ncbi:MAG: nucleotidyltransferase domain-containing protein [Solirubrobacterales bacterium]
MSDYLAASVPGLDGICLYGSVARGEEHEGSDIDLLVLGRDPELTPSQLRKQLPDDLREARVMFAYYTPATLDSYLHRWSRFGAHVRREGEILFDPDGRLRDVLEEDIPVSSREELEAQLRHLENYDDLRRFGGYFLLPLAHLYSIGRTVIFALLAERGVLEFDQTRATRLLEREVPTATDEIRAVARLRAFQERVSRRSRRPLPFSPRDCEDEVAHARDAVRSLIGLTQPADVSPG